MSVGPPDEVDGVLVADVTNDAYGEPVIVQALWANDAAEVYAGDDLVWKATAGGQFVIFPDGVEIKSLKVMGFGTVYIYLK